MLLWSKSKYSLLVIRDLPDEYFGDQTGSVLGDNDSVAEDLDGGAEATRHLAKSVQTRVHVLFAQSFVVVGHRLFLGRVGDTMSEVLGSQAFGKLSFLRKFSIFFPKMAQIFGNF